MSKRGGGGSVGNLVKSVATYLVGMAMFTGMAVSRWYLKAIQDYDYLSEEMRRNWTGRSQQSFGSGIDNGCGERVVLLNRFSPVGAGTYKQSFTCRSTVLVALAQTHSESTEWVTSFGKRQRKTSL